MEYNLNPIEAMYENKPRRWWLYTITVLLFVVVLGWSSSAHSISRVLAAKGTEVAYGIFYGIIPSGLQPAFKLYGGRRSVSAVCKP